MKTLLLILLTSSLSYGQWVNKTVNNDFDDAYRISYNRSTDGSLLKLEDVDGELAFYIQNAYTCTDMPLVDIVFIFSDGTKEVLQVIGATSEDRQTVFLSADLLREDFINSFKRASRIKLRINDVYCDTFIYEFSMSGSSNAVNFMTK